jgi:broad specificity phosphatase PhoE
MTRLALLRHFPTAWNEAGKIQGRADVPLTEASRAALAGLAVPPEFASFRVMCSPLKRARETALALGLAATSHARWIEMDWGDYEGRRLAELRAKLGDQLAENEARGLDFMPPGGESPRMVFARVQKLLRDIATHGADTLAVTHRGVIRAVYAQASGWAMIGRPQDRLVRAAIQVFRLAPDGQPAIERLNVALVTR